jgi:hypothetical protein
MHTSSFGEKAAYLLVCKKAPHRRGAFFDGSIICGTDESELILQSQI